MIGELGFLESWGFCLNLRYGEVEVIVSLQIAKKYIYWNCWWKLQTESGNDKVNLWTKTRDEYEFAITVGIVWFCEMNELDMPAGNNLSFVIG